MPWLPVQKKKLVGCFWVEVAEMVAIRDGLQLAPNWRIKVAEVESDALQVVKNLNSLAYLSYSGLICLDIKSLFRQVNCGSCRFIPYEGNKVAHTLASFTLRHYRIDSGPLFILSLVRDDLIQ